MSSLQVRVKGLGANQANKKAKIISARNVRPYVYKIYTPVQVFLKEVSQPLLNIANKTVAMFARTEGPKRQSFLHSMAHSQVNL